MHDPRGARNDLHRFDPAPPRAAQIDRQHEGAKDVVAPGRERERLSHLDHQVRLAQAPPVRDRRGRRGRGREIAGRRAGRGPLREHRDLRRLEASLAFEEGRTR